MSKNIQDLSDFELIQAYIKKAMKGEELDSENIFVDEDTDTLIDETDEKNFTMISNFILISPLLSTLEFRVYLVIKFHAFGKNSPFPSISRIATLANCGERSVNDALKTLISLKLIDKTKRIDPETGKKTRNNQYRICGLTKEMKLNLLGMGEMAESVKETKEEIKQQRKEQGEKAKTKKETKKTTGKNNEDENGMTASSYEFKNRMKKNGGIELLPLVEQDEAILHDLNVLFNFNKFDKYKGNARPNEVSKIYLALLKATGKRPTEKEIEMIDFLLCKTYEVDEKGKEKKYQAKPIVLSIEEAAKKGETFGSLAFFDLLEGNQQAQNKKAQAMQEIQAGKHKNPNTISTALTLENEVARYMHQKK